MSVAERLGLASLDLVVALAFLATWWSPWPQGPLSQGSMESIFGVEFFAIVAALLIGPPLGKSGLRFSFLEARRIVVGAVCIAFAAWFGWRTGLWWAAAALVLLIADKLLFAVRLRRRSDGTFADADAKLHYAVEAAVRAAIFALALGIATALPWPALGVLPDSAELAATSGDATSGPHVVLVAGFLHFATLAALKFRLAPWLQDRLAAKR